MNGEPIFSTIRAGDAPILVPLLPVFVGGHDSERVAFGVQWLRWTFVFAVKWR